MLGRDLSPLPRWTDDALARAASPTTGSVTSTHPDAMTAIAAIAMAQGLMTFRPVVMLVSFRAPVKPRYSMPGARERVRRPCRHAVAPATTSRRIRDRRQRQRLRATRHGRKLVVLAPSRLAAAPRHVHDTGRAARDTIATIPIR
jgi:hypothetical protein